MQNSVRSLHPTQIGASHISKDKYGRIGVSIGNHPLIHDLLSILGRLCKQGLNISSSLIMEVGYTKFLVGTIDHFTGWEASEATNKIVLSRVSREQGRIRKIWTENMYENWWPYHITSHSTTWESLLEMVCEANIMMSVVINMPT